MGTIDDSTAVHALALQQLVSDYFWELDTTYGLNSSDFFTEDGVVDIGKMSFRGHAEMRAFYAGLLEQVNGVRTTRHAYTNLRIAFGSDDSAVVDLLAFEFSAMGTPPLVNAATPTIVSDARLRCLRQGRFDWRIAELSGRPIFAGNDPVLNRLLIG